MRTLTLVVVEPDFGSTGKLAVPHTRPRHRFRGRAMRRAQRVALLGERVWLRCELCEVNPCFARCEERGDAVLIGRVGVKSTVHFDVHITRCQRLTDGIERALDLIACIWTVDHRTARRFRQHVLRHVGHPQVPRVERRGELGGEVVAPTSLVRNAVAELVGQLPVRVRADLDVLLCRVVGEDPVDGTRGGGIRPASHPETQP